MTTRCRMGVLYDDDSLSSRGCGTFRCQVGIDRYKGRDMTKEEIDDVLAEIFIQGKGRPFDMLEHYMRQMGDDFRGQKELVEGFLPLCKLLNKLFFDYGPPCTEDLEKVD